MNTKLNSLKILKLSQNATLREIRMKYLQLSMTNHPDKKGGNKEKFMEIKKAYEILSQSDSLSEEKVAEDAYQSSSRHDFHKATTKESSKFKSQMIGFTLAVTLLFIINHQFQSQSKRTTRMQQQIGSQIASKRIQ